MKALVDSSFLGKVGEERNVYYRIPDQVLEACFK